MKKILLIGAGIIVLTLAIAPKFVGNTFNQKLDSMLVLINENPVYSASIKERTNTWFTSTATINIAFDSGAFASENSPELKNTFADMNLEMEIDAQHGPILTQNGFALGWLSWKAKVEGESLRDTLEFDADSPFYQISNYTNLLGNSRFTDHIPSFTLQEDEVFSQFVFSGWNGSGSFSDSEANYQGSLDTISFESAFGKFALKQWGMTFDLQGNLMDSMTCNFYDSTSTMQIQNISFEQASDQITTQLNEFKMDAVSDFDESTSLMDYQINFSLADLASPDLNLSAVNINTEVNNLSEQFFKAYQSLMTEIGKEPTKMQENMNTFMQTQLLTQLKAEPEFNISSFAAKVNQGNVTGSFNSKIHQVNELPEPLESPVFWLQHLMANGQINADESVALWMAINITKSQIQADPSAAQMTTEEITTIAQQQAPATLQGLQKQGLLSKTTDGYQLTFSLKEGQALLNNKPMPLPTGQ